MGNVNILGSNPGPVEKVYGQRSILSPSVVVERDAHVEQSVIFDDVVIEPGASIRRAIVDKESRIWAGASIGYNREADKRRGCAISDNGIVVVPKGMKMR